jgi:hypothetical protein
MLKAWYIREMCSSYSDICNSVCRKYMQLHSSNVQQIQLPLLTHFYSYSKIVTIYFFISIEKWLIGMKQQCVNLLFLS